VKHAMIVRLLVEAQDAASFKKLSNWPDEKSPVLGGTVSLFNIKGASVGLEPGLIEPGVQYVYDLEVDPGTQLHPAEDGIDWLRLLAAEEVKAALIRHEFKPSSAYVMIDFFVQHGVITSENEREYAEIVSRLHGLPLPTPTHGKVQLSYSVFDEPPLPFAAQLTIFNGGR